MPHLRILPYLIGLIAVAVMFTVAFFGLIALIVTLVPAPARAHSWYEPACCSDKDCRPLREDAGETYRETPEGYRLWDGRLVTYRAAKPSPDGHAHLCENPWKQILCFYAPQGGT